MGRKYEFIRELGSGGMSVVYLARDKKLSMRWTIKKIDVTGAGHIADSVKREAMALRRLRTDSIARLADVYREGNYICLCMEYVEGRNLKDIVREEPELARKNVLKWAEELTDIIILLHSLEPALIYRDMKPANVILKPDGKLCLIDFGASRLKIDTVRDETPTGTKGYAAPEQFRGYADERSDIYALGKTIAKISGNKMPKGLGKIVAKATDENPDRRYQSAMEMKKALERLKKRKRTVPILAIAAFVLLITLLTAGKINARNGNYRKAINNEKEDYLRLSVDSGKTEEALLKIDEYLKIPDGSDRSELCFEAGLAAFFELSDYEKAEEYFSAVESSRIPEASFLKIISEELAVISDDKSRLIKAIEDYRELNNAKGEGEEKLRNILYISRAEYIISSLLKDGKRDELLKRALEDAEVAEKLCEGGDSSEDFESGIHDLKYLLLKESGFDEKALEEGLKWLEGPDGKRDKTTALKRILEMDEIYEKNGDLRKRLGFMEKAEMLFPYEAEDIYIRHIRLLLETNAGKEETGEVLKNASLCGNLEKRKEYRELERKYREKYTED